MLIADGHQNCPLPSKFELWRVQLQRPTALLVPRLPMYEDLNQIATLRFNKELESISSETREKVREMQQEYAALTGSSGVRSGPQEASIGRAQIEGSERQVRALFDIWVDLVKRRNGHVSHPDVDFITKKLEGFAQTKKGHLHRAFSSQRMGAVVNLLTEEAGRRLSAATTSARRDLAIMVREHEVFSRIADAGRQEASRVIPTNDHARPARPPGTADHQQGLPHEGDNALRASAAPSISERIWTKIWSWIVVSTLVVLSLGLWGTFLTSGHPWASDEFFVVAAALFLAKFWTWEDTRQQPGGRKQWLLGGMTVLVLSFTGLALRWDHTINGVSSAPILQGQPASGTGVTRDDSAETPASAAPTEEKPRELSPRVGTPGAEGTTISVADRVKIIIARQLQVSAAQLKSTDDFEANLGADPTDIYFMMRSLEQEYNISIPATGSSNLHTVGETISYIEKRVQKRQEHERKALGKPVSSDATPMAASGAPPPPANKTPALRYILESDFDDEVLRQTAPVLVFFCTEYQDTCRVMTPTISSIAQEQQGRLKTVAVDVNINKNLPKKVRCGLFRSPCHDIFPRRRREGPHRGCGF